MKICGREETPESIYIFVVGHPVVKDSYALHPIVYFADEEYKEDDSQEYNNLEAALSNADSLKKLYLSWFPETSVVVLDHHGNEVSNAA